MKERPILFSAPMVRAILDGSKTQTRRIWKMPSWAEWDLQEGGHNAGMLIPQDPANKGWYSVDEVACPYGRPGDQLWVRETWRIGAWDETRPAFALDYRDGPRKEWVDVPDPMCDEDAMFYRLWQQSTDDAIKAGLQTADDGNYHWEPGQSPCRWRPSIHMPRWASRILLEITVVRVERLQDISVSDAIREGYDGSNPSPVDPSIKWYADLWESIHGPGSWAVNPWVWVIEFRRIRS